MIGDERVRFCPQCKLNVYNFSAMPEGEIQRLIARRDGRLCARWYRRADGTILTSDCPVGFRARVKRVSRIAGAALSAFLGVSPLAAQTQPRPAERKLVQIENGKQVSEITTILVVDETGAVIPKSKISVLDASGKVVREGLTDADGEFLISSIGSGSYTLQVESLGFETARITDFSASARAIKVTVKMKVEAELGVIVTVEIPEPTIDAPVLVDPIPTASNPPSDKKSGH